MATEILKAYEDIDFLKRPELRPLRLQAELLKAQIIQDNLNVLSTVVVYGSARIEAPSAVRLGLKEAEAALRRKPDCAHTKRRLKRAQRLLEISRYYDVARDFSREMSRIGQHNGELEYVIVTGGGPGLMEAANRGAADIDAKSIGLNITLPLEQEPNPFISPELSFTFHYFSVRKMHFLLRAKAVCVFPGGYGTLDELFETLTLIQTQKSRTIPVILFGPDYWGQMINWQRFVDFGMIDEEDLELFSYADTADEAVRMILEHYGEADAAATTSDGGVPNGKLADSPSASETIEGSRTHVDPA